MGNEQKCGTVLAGIQNFNERPRVIAQNDSMTVLKFNNRAEIPRMKN
jgi:hypothetical protein